VGRLHADSRKKRADPSLKPERTLTLALVAIDFDDQPFVMTQPKRSDPFGNPQIDPIKREAIPQFYADFISKPSALDHGQTIHRYWMEISRGKVGVPKVDAFGPYRMPRKLFEYGLGEYGQEVACPTGFTCNGRMAPDADALWAKDAGAGIKSKYDRVLRLYAGSDETSVWQEFGEMKFNTKEDIPESWGNPDKTKPRWAPTRYVEWTSWRAGAQQWGLSSIRQGESSGTITHEMGHAVMNIGDNNNNPYVKPYHRVGTGTWDMMDRGGFNGPGGPHSRWVVPVQQGGSMPAGFLLRNKIWAGFVTPDQVLRLDRDSLPKSGLAVATIVARAVEPGPGQFAGVLVRLDGDAFTRPQRGAGGGGGRAAGGAATGPPAGTAATRGSSTRPGRHGHGRLREAERNEGDAHDCRLSSVERRAVSRGSAVGQPVRMGRHAEPAALLPARPPLRR
jgi:M6 family metalloprotease-like protein